VLLASLLFVSLLGYGTASAKGIKSPKDTVENFMNAVAGLKAAKAASYWVTEEHDNVSSQLSSVLPGTRISVSKLKLVVAYQTADTAVVTATYHLKIKYQGETEQNDEEDTFTLKPVSGTWLISSSAIWEHMTELMTPRPTPAPTGTTGVAVLERLFIFKA
jgi:hypothetical protein